MTFYIKCLIGGLAAFAGGILLLTLGFMEGSPYPTGLYTGPIAILLGIVLFYFAGRGLSKGE